ncbi:substrate-binding periplasmic protein [Shewanella maritima]|uniref:substrate-binding periplasmic protein n=1 Tax=Shewanella maritima TaxID=2520507 RepID=UPI003735F5A2
MYKFVFLLAVICTSFTAQAAQAAQAAQPLRYNVNASSGWVPYYIPNQSEQPGILGELVPMIMAKAQVPIEKHNYPPKRTNQALETGLLDFDVVSPDWFENHDIGAKFVKSIAILPIKEYIICRTENAAYWQDLAKIKGQDIGTVRGYLYHDDDTFNRVDFTSERELVKAIDKKRVNLAISGDLPALYWANELGINIALAGIHSDGKLVLRIRKEHHALLPQVNLAISQLSQDGTIEALIEKYTGSAHFNKAEVIAQ